MGKGFLITFEGIDYSGKSTQCELLVDVLKNTGIKHEHFREPGYKRESKDITEQIRSVLLNKENTNMTLPTEVFLFQGARAQLYGEHIIPLVKEGYVVIDDRSGDSSKTYQGYGRYFADPKMIQMIDDLNKFSMQGQKIQRTYLVDITIDEMVKRKEENGRGDDRLDNLELDFYERVRQGYLNIAKEEPERVLVLDGTKSKEDLHAQILMDFGIIKYQHDKN